MRAASVKRKSSVERGQLIRQILRETSILEIGGGHFAREGVEYLMNKSHST